MQWKDPELKVRPDEGGHLVCLRREQKVIVEEKYKELIQCQKT